MRFLLPIILSSAVIFPFQLSGAQTSEVHKDWQLYCDLEIQFKNHCVIRQILQNRQTQDLLLVSMVGYPMDVITPLLVFELPPGIQADKGVHMRVDDENTRSFDKVKCSDGSCVVLVALDGAAVKLLKVGSEARVAYVTPSGKPVSVRVSLRGFSTAFNSLASKVNKNK